MAGTRQAKPKRPKTVEGIKFGQRLQKLLSDRKETMSTADFAEAIGVTPDMVRKYFSGHSVPPLSEWPVIAWALGLKSAADLLPDLPAKRPE